MSYKCSLTAVLLLLVVAISSCSPKEKTVPTEISIKPASLQSEPCTRHEIQFKVSCNKELEAGLDCDWARISELVQSQGDITIVKIVLDENPGTQTRTGKLTVRAGSKTADATFTQLTADKLLSFKQIKLNNIDRTSVYLKLPEDWSLKCENEDGTHAEWFDADKEGGKALVGEDISFQAEDINTSGCPRKGFAVVDMSGIELRIDVVQEDSGFSAESCGIFNFGGTGTNVIMDARIHQVSSRVYQDGTRDFCIAYPSENKTMIFKGLPDSFPAREEVSFTIYQNWLPEVDFRQLIKAKVAKTTDNLVWLLDGKTCFVIEDMDFGQ